MAFYKLEKAIGPQIYKKKIFLNERKEETLNFTYIDIMQEFFSLFTALPPNDQLFCRV